MAEKKEGKNRAKGKRKDGEKEERRGGKEEGEIVFIPHDQPLSPRAHSARQRMFHVKQFGIKQKENRGIDEMESKRERA